MANEFLNNLTVHGEIGEVKAVSHFIKPVSPLPLDDENEVIDFNRIIPMPENVLQLDYDTQMRWTKEHWGAYGNAFRAGWDGDIEYGAKTVSFFVYGGTPYLIVCQLSKVFSNILFEVRNTYFRNPNIDDIDYYWQGNIIKSYSEGMVV